MELDLDVAAQIGVDLKALTAKADLLEDYIRNLPYRQNILAAFSGITNAGGSVNFRVYDVPDGMQFYLARYIVWSDAHNPSTAGCFQSTSCWGGIYHGLPSPVNLADYFPPPSGGLGEAVSPNIIPYYKTFGRHESPEFQSPDNVAFGLVNGPATTNISVLLYGWLEEIREGRRYPRVSRNLRKRTELPKKMKQPAGVTMRPTDPFPVTEGYE